MKSLSRRSVLLASGASALGATVFNPPALAASSERGALRLARAAQDFLTALGENPKAQLALDDPRRTDWHWFPKRLRPNREGVLLSDMTDIARDAAMALVEAASTPAGYAKVNKIMQQQEALGASLQDYFFAVYGSPADARWALGIEGHHLSINAFVSDNRIAFGPLFMGDRPANASVPRAMQTEEERARAAFLSLPPSLRERARIAPRTPGDTITRNAKSVTPFAEEGVRFADLPQQSIDDLQSAVAEYTSAMPSGVAAFEMERFKALAPEQVYFAWAGSETPGEFYYWRLQTPHFLIEHDNSRDSAKHIHSVWRSFADDFGQSVA